MLISRASARARVGATATLAAILSTVVTFVVAPRAAAVEAPGGSVFAIQTNGPNGLVTLGDWYSSNAVGAGGGYHYIRFTVPCGWPAGLAVNVDLFSPEMNRVSGALARSEEPNGTYDSTQFELYGPGVTVGPGYASPAAGAGIPGTRTTFQPGAAGVPEAWMRYRTLAAPVACGNYVVRSQVLTTDPLNPTGTGDDQNGWRIRVGSDSDADPTNAPPANYDNPDGLIGTNDELTLGLDQASFQQDSGALACQTFFEYVSPGQASIAFNNFDMDGNTRVRYYAPSDPTYDPTASSGGVIGTLSTDGQWNGGTLATRVGDTIVSPESGWWRFVTCISTQNQFIQEGEAGRAAYYTQPPTPALTIAKSDGVAAVAPGQTITYTIDVANVAAGATAGAANNVVVHDILPAGVTYQSCGSPVPAQGSWACSESGGNVTFTQSGWINAGAAAQLTVTARVNQGTSGSIVNTTTADYTDQIGNPFLQVSASDTDTIAPLADLALTKTDGVASVTAGTSTTYTITLMNNGPTDEPAGATIADTIPAGVTPSESEPDCGISGGVFSCTTSSVLAAGASRSYQLTLAVPPNYALATLSNTASITFTLVPDPDPSNNSATDVDTVVIAADLSIAKADSADPVAPGDSFTYTLTVTNNGPSDASGLTVSDTVPAVFVVSSVTSASGSCGHVGNVVTCTRATMPFGATWVITVAVDVDLLAGGGLYTDTATVSATSPDPIPGNNDDSEGTIVTPAGDLRVLKSDGVASVAPGTSTTYTITLTNLGPSDVPAGVVLSDAIPANTVGSESETNCAIGGGAFTCTTAAVLISGASVSYQLTLAIDAAYPSATLVNTASVTSSTIPDPFPANNSATDTDTIAGSADLSLTKTDGVGSVIAGTATTYTITLTNNGPSTLPAGAVVSDPIPANTIGSESEPNCAIGGGAFTCTTTAVLAIGASVSYQLTLTVSSGYPLATLTNTASITSSPFADPVPGNNSASDVDTVTTSADLSIVKSDAPDPVGVGGTLTYTLIVANAGPADATTVSVVDTLPPSVTFGTATPSQGSCGQAAGTVTCSLGTIAAGATATIAITVTPTTVGAISNTATVSAVTSDPVPANNSDTELTVVAASADLSIAKTDGVATVDPGSSTTYTLTLTNNGPSDVPAGVVLTDQIPAGTIASENEADCVLAATTFTCTTTAILVSGASIVYRLTLAIDMAYPSPTLVNTAAITTSPVADPNPANNTSTDTDAVNPIVADLSVVKTDSVDPVQPGDTFSYTIAVTNAGPGDARNVTLSDTIPATLAVAGVTSTGTGACLAALNTLLCSIDPLVAGATWTVTVQVTVPPGTPSGTVTNTATVSGIGNTDLTNDSASQTTTIGGVTGVADLTITKTVDDASPHEGDTVTYLMLVTNAGPDDATGVQVTDELPAGLSIVSASSTQGSYHAATGVWDVGSVTAGETAGLQIRARVESGTAGTTIANRASVSAADQTDPSPGDDADSAPIGVEAAEGGAGPGGGGTAFTGLPGAAAAIRWMLALVILGMIALGLGGLRRPMVVRSSAPFGSDEAHAPPGRFLCEPFFFCKE